MTKHHDMRTFGDAHSGRAVRVMPAYKDGSSRTIVVVSIETLDGLHFFSATEETWEGIRAAVQKEFSRP